MGMPLARALSSPWLASVHWPPFHSVVPWGWVTAGSKVFCHSFRLIAGVRSIVFFQAELTSCLLVSRFADGTYLRTFPSSSGRPRTFSASSVEGTLLASSRGGLSVSAAARVASLSPQKPKTSDHFFFFLISCTRLLRFPCTLWIANAESGGGAMVAALLFERAFPGLSVVG